MSNITTAAESYKRRYVSVKETMSYVLFDSSKTFNIDEQKTFFVLNVLRLDPVMNTVISLINGWWDVINDGLLGAVIDKISTRWGKFKPYFLLYIIFGSALMMIHWLSPYFFISQLRDPSATLSGFAPLFLWLALASSYDVFLSVRDIAESGIVSAISPNPDDRVRLFSRAELISAIWENIPGIVMSLLIDGIKRLDATPEAKDAMFRSAFAVMGVITVATGVILAVFFFIHSKERIAQTVDRPKFLPGLRIILRSRPILLAIFADLFAGISRSTAVSSQWEKFYFLDVLGSVTLRDLVMIPGAPLSMLSYGYLQKCRERFSVKTLWLVGLHIKEAVSLLILIVGSFGKRYKSRLVMVPLLVLQDVLYKGTLSFGKIIPREITMDSIDYVEWKDGFRAEGMILATKGIIPKAAKNTLGAMTTLIMNAIGYKQGTGVTQTDKVQRSLFRLAFGLPLGISVLGMIPKFFYDLTGEKRQRMYEELGEIRRRRLESGQEL
ncbi:MAG: MFS transporter [Oscillospiraceae bacterium]|nr:MFS transporter [Oscillospiraceae bacterium]